jgi:NADH-quinone oxidoreductase subunit I
MSIWGTGMLNGLRITMLNMLRGPITVQYPRQKIVLPERARWAVEMKVDEDGEHKCTACLNCQKACPDYVIDIDVTTAEDRSKHINRWHYEIGACMMCGLCVEACPFDAIRMGHDYELARYTPQSLAIDLLSDTPAAKPKRAERPEGAAPAAERAATPAQTPATPEPAPADDAKEATDE